jgi:hypothetical protein
MYTFTAAAVKILADFFKKLQADFKIYVQNRSCGERVDISGKEGRRVGGKDIGG